MKELILRRLETLERMAKQLAEEAHLLRTLIVMDEGPELPGQDGSDAQAPAAASDPLCACGHRKHTHRNREGVCNQITCRCQGFRESAEGAVVPFSSVTKRQERQGHAHADSC